ncbi:hypothetical protein PRIPAC_89804 [Pristionchus pacificus]|uniref:Uncharacterized protein n=1 Tax=Pristionchus pacificus TaxID=54126 RepID=A0A2A6B3Y1_PRIPA|nr:hypothetical protein PRIPAC_89804 [Pristionchus pacificus]|eukprot:PDM60563.1 hypothetical protein PRIPAC_53541 [Pristionchus pacificus]
MSVARTLSHFSPVPTMVCPFPNGTIPIVYVNTFFTIFRYKDGISDGFVADFWNTAARYLHCDGVNFIHHPNYGIIELLAVNYTANRKVAHAMEIWEKSKRVKLSLLSMCEVTTK